MTEILFYEFERQRLEVALANLLERCQERGWRAVVQVGSRERLDALDAHLWTYRDESFLAHGTASTGHPEFQPVFLTDGADNPNSAQVRFFVDGAEIGDVSGYERAVYMFDGRDSDEKERARGQWRAAASGGHEATYWKQDASGRWVKQA